MNVIPNKIMWYLGYNNLGLILEQERKHWLMKTDKKKQIQNKDSGDIYEGILDNLGSDIIISTSKLDYKNNVLSTLKFDDEKTNDILELSNASFPFSIGSKGLMFARVTSINYPMGSLDNPNYKNYRIKFSNAKKKTLAFGISLNSEEVYAGEWIETSVPPTLEMLDGEGLYNIEVTPTIANTTNCKYLFPLETGLQPFGLENVSEDEYVSNALTDDSYIGYPLFWFTSDETSMGPTIRLGDDGYNSQEMAYAVFSTPGNISSKYYGKMYVNVDGTVEEGATPDMSLPGNWEIRCSPIDGQSFTNNESDYNINIDIDSICFYSKEDESMTTIPIVSGEGENNVFRMTKNSNWTFIDESTYSINMSNFISNNKEQANDVLPLTSVFDIYLDESVSYNVKNDNNVGSVGIKFTAANPYMDNTDRYPEGLNEWEGLPEWIKDSEGVPQHMAIYATHEDLEDKQVAALLLDPGKMKTTDTDLTNDEKGRIYVISNDSTDYVNNGMTDIPKPGRTIARICDIPTSVADFMNVEGLTPISVVDPKYVRNQVAYTNNEKNILWNVLNSKVVTPLSEDEFGNPFYVSNGYSREPYPYIFYTKKNLEKVDLITNNDFREWINLNPMVDPTQISVYQIANPGEGYEVNATGIIVIGGIAMTYVVNTVDDNGGVTGVSIFPQDNSRFINISNFDLQPGEDGITDKYGTMPVSTGEDPKIGSGLELVLRIDNYEDIRTKRGNIYDNLVAFVYEDKHLNMYKYITHESTALHKGEWKYSMEITEYDRSSSKLDDGGLSATDALTRMMVPYMTNISVCSDTPNRSLIDIKAITTPSFINITDNMHNPFHLIGEDLTLSRVDLCGFHCMGLTDWHNASGISESSIIDIIKSEINLDRDCYLIWQWKDGDRKEFRYGIIRRSMNNYVTTDKTSILPSTTSMKYNSYINTNASTTVVWDVPQIGPMMWVYNPNYNRKEIYTIDQDTMDMYISYSNEDAEINPNIMSWNDIDIPEDSDGNIVKIIDDNGKFNFYVYTNNPVQGTKIGISNVYNEYEFKKIITQGDELTEETPTPVGNWQLVFPRINQYKIHSAGIQSGVYNSEVKLRRLVPLRGEDIGEITKVVDSHGNNVNSKVVVFDQTTSGSRMKIYNKETNRFETL